MKKVCPPNVMKLAIKIQNMNHGEHTLKTFCLAIEKLADEHRDGLQDVNLLRSEILSLLQNTSSD